MKLLRSKLSIPEVASHSIDRPRLRQKILESTKADLILLIAPAGYGKTTLVAQLVSHLPRHAKAWYHLDRQDTEPSRFLSYLIEALSQPIPALKESGVQERLSPGQAPFLDAVDDLCFFFQEYRGPDVWLVLDNWETVTGQEEHTDIILRLASAGRHKLRLILASRVKPAFSTRKLQESGRAVIIGKDELAFNFSEFTDALKNRMPLHLEEAQVEHLWQKTAGWCVSIGLLRESFKNQSWLTESKISAAGKSLHSFNEYVEEELLKGMSSDLVSFLTKCSVLDVISPESAAAVAGENVLNIEENLRSLRASAVPHVGLDQPDTFRLHPLVRQAFNHVLRSTSNSVELAGVYQSASNYFRKQGAALEAVQSLMDLPNHEAALRSIDEDWHAIVAANGLNRVRAWLEQFPAGLVTTPLYIKTRTQLLSLSGENHRIVEYLSDKLDPDLYAGEFAVLANLWMHYHWALLHVSPTADYDGIRREWQALERRCGDPVKSVEAGVHVLLSLAAHQELREDKAIEHSRTCLGLLKEAQFDYRMTVKCNIALFTHFQGRSTEALAQYQAILAECEGKGAYTIAPTALVNTSEILLSCGQYRRAREAAERALQIQNTYGMRNRGVEMYVDRCRGIASWYLGETDEGFGHLDRSYETALEFDERERLSIALWLDFFHLLEGENKAFLVDAGAALGKRTEQRLLWLGREGVRATLAGKWPALGKSAADLLKLAVTANAPAWKVTACFLKAVWADGAKKPTVAKQTLRAGLRELQRYGVFSYPMANDVVSTFVIVKSIRWEVETDAASLLLKGDRQLDLAPAIDRELASPGLTPLEARRLLHAAADLQVRGLAGMAKRFMEHRNKAVATSAQRYLEIISTIPLPPLYIRMLGGFSVIAGGRNVSFGRKKSRQLLQLLLIEKCRSLHEEVIIETLWPECDPAKGRTNLRTCVKDLRRALDPHHEPRERSYIEYGDQHYTVVLPEGSSIDAVEFDTAIRRLEATIQTGGTIGSDQAAALHRTLSLFTGDLLPAQQYDSFTVEYRENLRRQFHRGCHLYADFLIDSGDYGAAERIAERGLEVDSLWGEGAQLLMLALVKQGRLFRALRVYREYAQRLQDELGLPPDTALRDYFMDLLAGHPLT